MDALTLAALAAAKKGGGGGADSTLNIELSMAQVQLIPLAKDQVDEFFTAEQTAAIVSNTKPHIRLFNDEVGVEIVFEKQNTVGELSTYSSVGIIYNFLIVRLVDGELRLINIGELGNDSKSSDYQYYHYILLNSSYSGSPSQKGIAYLKYPTNSPTAFATINDFITDVKTHSEKLYTFSNGNSSYLLDDYIIASYCAATQYGVIGSIFVSASSTNFISGYVYGADTYNGTTQSLYNGLKLFKTLYVLEAE